MPELRARISRPDYEPIAPEVRLHAIPLKPVPGSRIPMLAVRPREHWTPDSASDDEDGVDHPFPSVTTELQVQQFYMKYHVQNDSVNPHSREASTKSQARHPSIEPRSRYGRGEVRHSDTPSMVPTTCAPPGSRALKSSIKSRLRQPSVQSRSRQPSVEPQSRGRSAVRCSGAPSMVPKTRPRAGRKKTIPRVDESPKPSAMASDSVRGRSQSARVDYVSQTCVASCQNPDTRSPKTYGLTEVDNEDQAGKPYHGKIPLCFQVNCEKISVTK